MANLTFNALSGCAVAMLAGILLARSQAPANVRTPFTVTSTTAITNANGVPQHTRVETMSVREDGSSVETRRLVDGKPFGLRIIRDVSKQKKFVIDPTTESVTTYKLSSTELSAAQNSTCTGDDGGTLLGYKVVKRGHTRNLANGKILFDVQELSAPSLSCYHLYRKISEVDNGIPSGGNETTATSIVVGQSSQVEFDIPAGYVERSPSEVLKSAAAQEGRQCKTCELHSFPKLDEVYRSRQ